MCCSLVRLQGQEAESYLPPWTEWTAANMGRSQVEEYLAKVVQLFSYLTDKDLFAEIYRNQLAKRLLNQRSASDDMERLMIGASLCGVSSSGGFPSTRTCPDAGRS